MKVAGLGFRTGAEVASLRGALMAAGGADGLTAIATSEAKAGATVFVAFAAELGLPIMGVSAADLARQVTLTDSARVREKTGAGSLAEAAALAVIGSNARLLGARAVSGDHMATAAIAEGIIP